MYDICQNCGHARLFHLNPFGAEAVPCSSEIDFDFNGPDDAQLCGCGNFVSDRGEDPSAVPAGTSAPTDFPRLGSPSRPGVVLRAELVKLQTELERESFRSASPKLHWAAAKIGEILNRDASKQETEF